MYFGLHPVCHLQLERCDGIYVSIRRLVSGKTLNPEMPMWKSDSISKVIMFRLFVNPAGCILMNVGLSPLPVRVTTRIITFLVGNPYKPSFPLLLGGGTTQDECVFKVPSTRHISMSIICNHVAAGVQRPDPMMTTKSLGLSKRCPRNLVVTGPGQDKIQNDTYNYGWVIIICSNNTISGVQICAN